MGKEEVERRNKLKIPEREMACILRKRHETFLVESFKSHNERIQKKKGGKREIWKLMISLNIR
ncbi:Protein CBG25563 [Caenorhabditis briggsae]|uniref:Protein CBG25563 n=1 Tax=Caenorhabditis briggsae TaxID=6238 RepID=B6IF50_CAEBR|nr:Protein CBG25563 [Caenorhabditis briggsae]CAR98530.1 Protein CBG25563 [Caenorhabditis briggsae]